MTTKGKGGRPSRARSGTAAETDRWTIRGVPEPVRKRAVREADARGMTVGDYVAEALTAYARRGAANGTEFRSNGTEDRADGTRDQADGTSRNVPALPISDELKATLDAINDRLGKLEANRQTPFIARIFGKRP